MGINIVVLVACFFVGGIPVGLLVARACGIADIRKYGSGNIGASNVLRTVGVKAGLAVWLADALKGGLPTWLAGVVLGAGGWWHAAAALMTVTGHCFSPYLGFKGGRGVASSLGVLIGLDWRVGLVAFGIWLVVIFATRFISLASIIGAASASVLYPAFVTGDDYSPALQVCVIALGLLVIIRHEPNIRRLLAGTESRIGQKAKELDAPTSDDNLARVEQGEPADE